MISIGCVISRSRYAQEARTDPALGGTTGSLGTFSFGEPRTVELRGLDGQFEVYPVVG